MNIYEFALPPLSFNDFISLCTYNEEEFKYLNAWHIFLDTYPGKNKHFSIRYLTSFSFYFNPEFKNVSRSDT